MRVALSVAHSPHLRLPPRQGELATVSIGYLSLPASEPICNVLKFTFVRASECVQYRIVPIPSLIEDKNSLTFYDILEYSGKEWEAMNAKGRED